MREAIRRSLVSPRSPLGSGGKPPLITGAAPSLAALAVGDNINTKATWGSYSPTAPAVSINSPTIKEYAVNSGSWTTFGSYVLAEGDAVVLRETVTDNTGRSQAFFATRSVPVAVPVNTVSPAITGFATEGETLTRSLGSWTGYAPITYATQWRRGGVDIPGATGATYVLTAADVGSTITCTVTATNAGGSASATSAATATVASSGNVIRAIGYGQSNTAGMFDVTASPPTAATGTFYWDGATLTAVPNGNGVRNFCNTLASLSGRNVHVANAATGGASSSYFVDGSGGWTDFQNAFTGLGGVDVVFCRQGEGDADGSSTSRKANFKANWTAIELSIRTLAGKAVPMIWGSLMTYGGDQSVIADSEWNEIQEAIRELCDENPNMYLGASGMDATRNDVFHASAASHGEIGKRLAYAAASVLGFGVQNPVWYATAVTRTSTTATRITVAHALGTDFTPTSGITGFQVSADGSTWVTPSAAVRIDATTIELTHSSLSATGDRFVRYQYGTVPDITGIVKDNSILASPLQLTAGSLLVDYANPVMTSSATLSAQENQTFVSVLTASRPSTFAIGGTDAAFFQIVAGNELRFVTAPNYEAPADAGANNVYDITITPTAIDNGDVGAAQSVAVTVTDAAEGGRSYSFLGNNLVSGAGIAVHTFAVDIGGAASDRFILVGMSRNSGTGVPSSVTVGGVALSQITGTPEGNNTQFWGGLVTTGSGTQNVVITWPNASSGNKTMAVWKINGLSSTTPKAQAIAANAIAVDAGDLLFYFAYTPSSTEDVSDADQAPARQAQFNTVGFSADWAITSTDAAFNFGHNAGTFNRIKISFA